MPTVKPLFLGREFILDVTDASVLHVEAIKAALTVQVKAYNTGTGQVEEGDQTRFYYREIDPPHGGGGGAKKSAKWLAVPRSWGGTHFGEPVSVPDAWSNGNGDDDDSSSSSLQWEPPSFPHPYDVTRGKDQETAVKSFLSACHPKYGGSGIFVCECGFGKTYVAFRTAKELKERMLFVVHTSFLLGQAVEAAKRWMPGVNVTTVGEDKVDWSGDVVVALFQKVLWHPPPKEAITRFRFVVVDEVHHAAAWTMIQVVKQFAPKYLLGLTGTPVRNNKDEYILFWHMGPVLFHWFPDKPIVPTTALLLNHKSFFDAPTPKRMVRGGVEVDDWTALRKAHSRDQARNMAVMDYVLRFVTENKTGEGAIVFCKTVAHVERLAATLRQSIPLLALWGYETSTLTVGCYHGGVKSKKKRDEIMATSRILVATVDILSEGANLGNKSLIAIATMLKTARQLTGRGVRPGREHVIILDARDRNELAGVFFRKRVAEYNDAKYDVCSAAYEESQKNQVGPYELQPLPPRFMESLCKIHARELLREEEHEAKSKIEKREKARKARKRSASSLDDDE